MAQTLRTMVLAGFTLLATATSWAADKTTHHSLALAAGPLGFTAAVETQKLTTQDGKPAAEIVTTAFWRDATPDPAARPVTFVFNGGPGAGSAWLDLGAVGPWRVPLAIPVVPSQSAEPVDNEDTWLGFTDLVFIDPPGTGYSRAIPDTPDGMKPFITVDGDIRALATTIHRWLIAHQRLAAPVFLAGESYGGFRAPRVARALLEQQGVGVSGIIMISPVLDFNGRDATYAPLRDAALLPSLAAAYRHATSRDDLQDVERYATGAYLTDLLQGPSDAAAQARIATQLSAFTGLDPSLVRRRAGRLQFGVLIRDRNPGFSASAYDLTLLAQDPFPAAERSYAPDPALDGLRGPIESAMLQVYSRLDWTPDGAPARQYLLLNEALARGWDYGSSNDRPESMTALRQYLALDPAARALVIHGLYDVVTPYFADKLLLDQVPATIPPGRLALHAYAGGHMLYTVPASRHALQQDAAALVAASLAARAAAVAH